MRKILVAISIFMTTCVFGQGFKIGVRSGLNYAKFRGPLETGVNESYGINGGILFGLNYTQYLTKDFGLRFELLYIQSGTTQNINGESYNITRLDNGAVHYENGIREQNLEINNAYFSIPITAHLQLNKRWEILAGGYVGFLVSPSAGGQLFFDSQYCDENRENCENPDGYFFRQSLIFDYNSDRAFGTALSSNSPTIIIDGQAVNPPGAIGAYYYYDDEITDSFINSIDLGLTAGVNYFLNKSFYVGLRVDYGLRDITNTQFDVSYESLNPDNTFIQREDKDTHLGFQASFGFRF